MKTIFFPFTSIEASLARHLAAFLSPLTLLQPSADTVLPAIQRLADEGSVTLLQPAGGARESLQDLLTSFEQWADQHAGSDRAALRQQGRTIPFFDGQSTARLVADIRRGTRPTTANQEMPVRPPLIDAQLFLAMAQKFDRQQADLARAIDTLTVQEEKMLTLLKGEDEPAQAFPLATRAVATASTAMVDRRLRAWALVMTAADACLDGDDVLFLTLGKDVADQLAEVFPTMVSRLQISGTADEVSPVEAGDDLPAWLFHLLRGDDNRMTSLAAGLQADVGLLHIPAIAPRDFLDRLTGQRGGTPAPPSSQAASGSTWIGCLTPCGKNHKIP